MIEVDTTAMHRRALRGRAVRVSGTALLTGAVGLTAIGCGTKSQSAEPAAGAPTAQRVQKGRPELRDPAPAKPGVDGRYAPYRLRPAGKPGQVLVENGPFVSRLEFQGLSLRPGDRPVASGSLKTGVEDSELLGIDLETDFYDGKGDLVGKGTRHYGPGPSLSGRPQRFSVRSDKPAPTAVAALVVVVNFVND